MMPMPRSYKHPILEYIFKKKRKEDISPKLQEVITFTYNDIREAMTNLNYHRNTQASLSNFVIDLTRQDRGIASRVPKYIVDRGYDLLNMKSYDGERIAGAFLYVGIGNEVKSWLEWPESMKEIRIDSSIVPSLTRSYIRQDEGALFSIIDYCDVLTILSEKIIGAKTNVIRIQHPLKWQPNEIDGLYASEDPVVLFPIEAKALSTNDQLNLYQLRGELLTMMNNFNRDIIQPLGCQMTKFGMQFAIFPQFKPNSKVPLPIKPIDFIRVILEPLIEAWNGRTSNKKDGQRRMLDFD